MRRALFSVSDKQGVVEFGRELVNLGWEIISTGGTLRALEAGDVPVRPVADVTEHPEMMNGRVKTLHPRIHGGILANRDLKEHPEDMRANGVGEIDLVVVNLYPFEQTIEKDGVTEGECIENIDIGGPCMLRAAAKNFHHVTVVSDPNDYSRVLEELSEAGEVSRSTRKELALKAFAMTARYDAAIVSYFNQEVEQPDASELQGKNRRTCAMGKILINRQRFTVGQGKRAVSSPLSSCRAKHSATTTWWTLMLRTASR